ncbi:MAG: DUF1559 domain-containing protein [Pirellulaceae bacterium]|nr:DUF1559 domain-containing protein [Pirellulaceae bacterium]
MNVPPNSRESAAERPPQFSIRGLLWLTGGVAIAFALVTQMGESGFVILAVLASLTLLWLGFKSWTSLGFLIPIGFVGCLLAVGWLMSQTEERSRTPSKRGMCSNNLKQIAYALHLYHDTYGSFPPAYVADQNGRPMHSWRVLLLPFIEQKALYDEYRFDEPWDGPHNRTLADSMPSVYRCPSDPRAKPDSPLTSYLAVVGAETTWPGEKARTFRDIKDGTSNTLLFVESHQSGIHWMEPRDLHTGQMAREINPSHGQGICSCHPECAGVAFVDASVRFLKATDVSRSALDALLTIAGGEDEPLD